METTAKDVDAYLAALPENARATLEGLRQFIRGLAPHAVEVISYGVPTFRYRGRPLIYFAAAKKHLALYGIAEGTIRFQPGEPPSDASVRQMIEDRLALLDADAARPRRKKPATDASS